MSHYHCLVWICISPASSVRQREVGDGIIIVELCNVPWRAGTKTEKKHNTGSPQRLSRGQAVPTVLYNGSPQAFHTSGSAETM